ncbi:hypothetical protein CDV31_011708 [Fusarium ambrosium]|uniref:2EXR domain-containing protein n=1 Tax=Fusarium ambrosium TaxID=131363 RepID=A0A428TF78_9HYPO|nr:hypothetical protein CDV31_011708 [Fusarium ambrosium]
MATFHPFPHLPLEIRTIIWHLTVEPRQVEIRLKDAPWGFFKTLHATSTTPIPSVMQACHESRNLGLYQRGFAIGAEPRYLWVNYDIDLISIGKTWFRRLGDCRRIIRRLKFQRENCQGFFYSASEDWEAFTNLQEMYILCEDGVLNWHDGLEFWRWPCPVENVRFIDFESGEEGEIVDGDELDRRWDEILAQSDEDEA